jgi:hypothetical protein
MALVDRPRQWVPVEDHKVQAEALQVVVVQAAEVDQLPAVVPGLAQG